MTGIRIEVKGVNRILALLHPEQYERALRIGIRAAALEVKGHVAQYPSSANAHRPQPFVSDKQRRFFFAALRDGRIEVPYRRGISPGSQTLGRRWTIRREDQGLTQVIGNNASYASLVQGEAQTAYHKETGWKTTDDVAKENVARVNKIVNDYIFRAITRQGGM